jgi:hypothetical protein
MSSEKCPFAAGNVIVYQPSEIGRAKIIMTEFARLIPGEKYRIARIEGYNYIVPEGFENTAGGGLFWTEFTADVSK